MAGLHHQKIEIPPEFPWVTDEFRAKHNAWLLKMFGMDDDNKAVVEYAQPEKKVTRARRKRRMVYEHEGKAFSTLGELLDGIEGVFDSLRLPDDKLSWLSKKEMRALRKLGVHVPNPWLLEVGKELGEVDDFPMIMSVSTSTKTILDKSVEIDRYAPTLIFAIRQPKLPVGVEIADGVPYLFGQCISLDGKNFWMAMYVTVTKAGKVTMCKQLQVNRVPIRHNKRDPSTGSRLSYISEKRWIDSAMTRGDDGADHDRFKRITEAMFINMFAWWRRRDERWSVGVRKDGNRVTFGVEQENTKLYFADRDKSIKAADGKAKRIIHHVREHDRVQGDGSVSTVREHIRGIREFDWNGYHCVVTSPQFHNKTSAAFCLAPVDIDGEINTKKNTVGVNKIARLLANFEDYGPSMAASTLN